MLTNSAREGREAAEEIEKALARFVLGIEVKVLALAPEEMNRYTGSYALKLGEQERVLRVFMEQEKLMGQLEGQGANQLLYQGDNIFSLAVDPDIRLIFTMENGRAKSFVLHQGGRTMSAEKKE